MDGGLGSSSHLGLDRGAAPASLRQSGLGAAAEPSTGSVRVGCGSGTVRGSGSSRVGSPCGDPGSGGPGFSGVKFVPVGLERSRITRNSALDPFKIRTSRSRPVGRPARAARNSGRDITLWLAASVITMPTSSPPRSAGLSGSTPVTISPCGSRSNRKRRIIWGEGSESRSPRSGNRVGERATVSCGPVGDGRRSSGFVGVLRIGGRSPAWPARSRGLPERQAESG